MIHAILLIVANKGTSACLCGNLGNICPWITNEVEDESESQLCPIQGVERTKTQHDYTNLENHQHFIMRSLRRRKNRNTRKQTPQSKVRTNNKLNPCTELIRSQTLRIPTKVPRAEVTMVSIEFLKVSCRVFMELLRSHTRFEFIYLVAKVVSTGILQGVFYFPSI